MTKNSAAQKGRIYFIAATSLCVVLGLSLGATAQETAGLFHVQGSIFNGIGIGKVEVGKTITNDSSSISGGGGFGGAVTLGYGLTHHLDLDFTGGYQTSELSPTMNNATATFSRSFYLATLKYRIPVAERFHIKVGVGGGIYIPGKLDIDSSGITNGARDVVTYENATGAHLLTEFELFVMKDAAVNIGLKYYSVVYKESSGTHNGQPVYFTEDKVKNFDGSGFDLVLSFVKYI